MEFTQTLHPMLRFLAPLCIIFVGYTCHADDLTGLPNGFQHSPNLFSSGQPNPDQFSNLADRGFEAIVNLAPKNLPASLPNEQNIVEKEGMIYLFLPVDWNNPDPKDFAQFEDFMQSHADKKVLVHCWVNARASGFVYLWQVTSGMQQNVAARDDLRSIWSHNKGFELENVPHWSAFFDDVLRAHQ